MGLSSSQARLLSLTGRMHDIEYKAQKLEAQKLQMANESTHVYKEYEDALNKTKVQFKTMGTDGSIKYNDATYNALLEHGYYIQFANDLTLWGKDGAIREGLTQVQQSDVTLYETTANKTHFVASKMNAAGTTLSTVNNTKGYKEIYTADQLKTVTGSGNYILMNDIDMSGVTWSPKSFNGTLDGNGHKITGLNNSLFSSISGAKISNLELNINATTNGTTFGALANSASGTSEISNVIVSGNITSTTSSTAKIGGLIGQTTTSGSNIKFDHVTSNVDITHTGTGEAYIGGVLGYQQDVHVNISNSNYSGDISSNSGNVSVGGIIGLSRCGGSSSSINIDSCYSSGTISTPNASNNTQGSGGIVGTVWAATSNAQILNSYSEMNITSKDKTGGIAGYFEGYVNDCAYNGSIVCSGEKNGGIVGTIQKGALNDVYSTGSISNIGSSTRIGSIVGEVSHSISAPVQNMSTTITGYNPIGNITTMDSDSADMATINSVITNAKTNTGAILQTNEVLSNPTFEALYDVIASGKYYIDDGSHNPAYEHEDDYNWFSNMLNGAQLFLFKKDENNEFYQTDVATDTGLQEVSNDIDLKKAEAKYEADMRKINAKDKKFDTDLAALESERNAIKTEMDTLKTVAKENVERTFKLFS